MSVNYSAGLSPYDNKGKCGMPEQHDEIIDFSEKCHQLAELIKQSKLTVIHTGAGISTAAGIPDFRGPNGVWTLEKEGKSPNCNITFDKAVPTFSHRCLVVMEKLGLIHYIISQNVDGLHVRSGFPRDRLAELHGNMFARKCQLCKREFIMDTVSPTMGLKFTGENCPFKKSRGRCRGLLRDSILDWEDALPEEELETSEKMCRSSELSIVIGSSLQIFPAAKLPLMTKRNQGKLVIINLQATKSDNKADLRIHGYADKVFQIVAEDLQLMIPEFTCPSLCLESTNPLPELKPKITKPKTNSRKRKIEDVPCTTAKSETNSESEVVAVEENKTTKPQADSVIIDGVNNSVFPNHFEVEQRKLPTSILIKCEQTDKTRKDACN